MNRGIQHLQTLLGYQFVNLELLEHALTHRSFSQNHNERLEYLGDALLSAIVAAQLFEQFPEGREGSLTRLRARLVKKETLAEVAIEMQLGPYLKLGGGELKSGGQQRQSILADTVEALICAIYLDSDFERCRQVVLAWYAVRFNDLTMSADQRDPKSQLQEYLQSRQRALPVYRLIDESTGGSGQEKFLVGCRVDGLLNEITAEGSSRRAAEQVAASIALEQVNVES